MGAHEYDQSNRGCTAGLVRLPRGPACQFRGAEAEELWAKGSPEHARPSRATGASVVCFAL